LGDFRHHFGLFWMFVGDDYLIGLGAISLYKWNLKNCRWFVDED
jgi:hypothetical protein